LSGKIDKEMEERYNNRKAAAKLAFYEFAFCLLWKIDRNMPQVLLFLPLWEKTEAHGKELDGRGWDRSGPCRKTGG